MKPLVLLPLILIGLSFALTGCITCQECGSLKRNHEITNLFLNNEIIPGYSYYFNGRSQWPTAVMAIESSYTVKAQFWKPVDLAGQELSGWLQSATNWKGMRQTNKNGAEILSPEGERVGIFFSKYDNLVTKFSSDKVIQVYPPSYQAGQGTGLERNGRN
jgi:hypothetical protein